MSRELQAGENPVSSQFASTINLTVKCNQFTEGAEDDAGIGAGRSAPGAREMVHANLGNGISVANRAGKNLGIDQRAGTPNLEVVKDSAFIELVGTVDVSDFHAEEETDQTSPAPGVEPSDPVILATKTEATDNVTPCHQRQKWWKIVHVKLAVTVGVKDQRL